MVNAKNLLDIYLADQTPKFRDLVREAPIIPETLDARDVVTILRDAPVHAGLVHDEYGVFQGVVTSADILEAIVGSFSTEDGPAEPAAVKRDDGSYLISGWMSAIRSRPFARNYPSYLTPLSDVCRLSASGVRQNSKRG